MSLKNNIIRVFSANFLSMISGIVISFIVPAILSVENYSYLKTYTFYVSYITFFSVGFVDGIYLKYGGRNESEINRQDLKNEHRFYIITQLFFTIIIFFIGAFNKNIILIITAFTIIPLNVSGFYKLYYQATGNFKNYSIVSYIYTLAYFIFNVILSVIIKSDNYILYCLSILFANGIVLLIFEYKFYKENRGIKSYFDPKVINNIKVGFFILIGNMSVILFYAVDRWFIKIFFSLDDFAYYSFALSMLNVINILVSAISVTFYNYLSKGENESRIKKLKKYFLILGAGASLGYFIFAAIISLFLNKYNPSLRIISITFASYPYMIVINALYVNLYKARKDEKKYVLVVFKMVAISIIYNIIAIGIWRRPEAIALATTLSFITWYIYSMKDFKYLTSNIKEVTYLSIVMVGFLIFSNLFNWFWGGIGYAILLVVMNMTMYKLELVDIFKIVTRR